jgi:predicted dehydrogenase
MTEHRHDTTTELEAEFSTQRIQRAERISIGNSQREIAGVSSRPAARPRLGFAGVGWIGRNRLEAIARSGLGEIVAIHDPVTAAAEQACESVKRIAASGDTARHTADETHCIADFDALLDLELDGIVLATPSALHAEQAIAALQRGHAVFCQKPLGRNSFETRSVIDAARAADRLLHVDLSYRFTTGMQKIRDLIGCGELGRIYAVQAEFHNAYGPDKAWFYDPALSGGGCLLDLGIHLVDLALWCLDFPVVTSATGQLLNGQPVSGPAAARVEDYAAAQLLLDETVSMQLACSWKAPAGADAEISLTFFGDKGGARFANINGSFYHFKAEHFLPDRSRRTLASPPDEWGGRAAIAWAQRLATSSSFDPAIEHLSSVAETLDRIYGRVP